jgi:hypothetical protein
MRKRSGLFVLNVIILSAAGGITTPWSGIVLAGDKCITEPNLQLPQGSHWYYHTDPESHHKCWYVGRPGMKVPQTVPRESRSSPKPKSDARITKNMDANSEVSHQFCDGKNGRTSLTHRPVK